MSSASFNFEVKSSFSVRIETDDNNGGTFEKQFTINVSNVAEPPTDIQLSNQTIAENQMVGTTIGTFSTTDEDDGESYDYNLIAGTGDDDNSSFTIATGQLRSNEVFDLETKSSYSILVETDDGNGNKFSKSFTVTITGENETPTDISLNPTSINENELIGTNIGTLSTVDVDVADTHTYTLIAGDGDADNASFSIAGNSLLSAEVFNFEIKSTYSIRIQTRDNVGATFSKAFNISVQDTDDAPSDISLDQQSILENRGIGATVGLLSSVDEDTESVHTYSLVAGDGDTDNAIFALDGQSVKTNTSLDFETKSNYSIRIQTEDNTGLTFSKSFTITILDAPESPTDITLDSQSIDENEAPESAIGTFTTTDDDTENIHTYSLIAGEGDTDNDAFTIVGSILNAAESFNFEAKSTYSIRVQTDDGVSNPFSKTFEITVQDVNEAPTSISLSSNELSEDADTGFEVGIFATQDVDVDDSFTYSLTAGSGDTNNALFRIENDKLIVDADLTAEASPLTLRVQSTDTGGLSVQEVFEIMLEPVLGLLTPDLKVYPNPAKDVLFIETESPLYLNYNLIDGSGKHVVSGKKDIGIHKLPIPITSLLPGIYYLKLTTTQQIRVKPVIIKH